MPLSAGARLGPYEIVALLGAGETGEVYKARNTRLDWTVAGKTTALALAADSQFRERFDREAHAIAAFNQTICQLSEVGPNCLFRLRSVPDLTRMLHGAAA